MRNECRKVGSFKKIKVAPDFGRATPLYTINSRFFMTEAKLRTGTSHLPCPKHNFKSLTVMMKNISIPTKIR
jgi:hypothetical protein